MTLSISSPGNVGQNSYNSVSKNSFVKYDKSDCIFNLSYFKINEEKDSNTEETTQSIASNDIENRSNSATNSVHGQLVDAFIESYIERYDKTCDSDKAKHFKEVLKQLISKADTDDDGSLSMDELNSFDVGDDKNLKKLVNELETHFNELDKDRDGKLSLNEMMGLLKKDYSIEELAEMAKNMSDSNKKSENKTVDNCSSSAFFQKLIDKYNENNPEKTT